MHNGNEQKLDKRIDELNDTDVKELLIQTATNYQETKNHHAFEIAYLKKRWELANQLEKENGKKKPMVSTELRQFLSSGWTNTPSPRLLALEKWAINTWVRDINSALNDGFPRKTIVFTSWVGLPKDGRAAKIQLRLSSAFSTSLRMVKKEKGSDWVKWHEKGISKIEDLKKRLGKALELSWDDQDYPINQVNQVLARLLNDELGVVLSGKCANYLKALSKQIRKQLDAVKAAKEEYLLLDKNTIEARGALRSFNDKRGRLEHWGGGKGLQMVELYTGNENRVTRDSVSSGFCNIVHPWVIIASNVGAEGIDLHTYTRRIVHFDLEWNPAKMEQREGRGDRRTRIIKDKLDIYYCLVPRTYDERMFHQLVARDRWHGVLLGKGASKLAKEEDDAQIQIVPRETIKKIRLNLAPKLNRK